MKKFYSLIFVGLLTGCGSVHHIGNIGNTEFYAVKSRSLQGPNFTALVVSDESGRPQVHSVFGGPGIGQTVISAGGAIGASAVLRPSRSETNVAATGGSGSQSSASASSSSTGSTGSTTNNGAHDNQNGNSGH